jgi:hypothetical protein
MKSLIALSLTAFITLAQADPLLDPMRPPSVQAKTHTENGALKVTAILRSGERRIAIIDDKAIGEGDTIGNATIDSIGVDEVHYTRAGRHETARLVSAAMPVRIPARK